MWVCVCGSRGGWGSGGPSGVWSNTLPHVRAEVFTVDPVAPSRCSRDGQMLLVTSLLDLNSVTVPCLLPLESITDWKRETFHDCGGEKL